MARKKKNEERQRQQMIEDANHIADQLGLDKSADIKVCAKQIIEAADQVMKEICEKSDSIKIDGWQQVKEHMAETVLIDKGLFFELVEVRCCVLNGNSISFDKQLPKIDDGFDWTIKHAEMQRRLYKELERTQGDLTKVLTNAIEPEVEAEIDESQYIEWPNEVKQIIDDCAKTRNYINGVLWPRLAKFANAFAIYCQAETWEFYDILKWYHYRQGDYPSKGNAPKLWDIINKFQYAMRQMDKYGFDFGREYCKRAGLNFDFEHECMDSFFEWDL